MSSLCHRQLRHEFKTHFRLKTHFNLKATQDPQRGTSKEIWAFYLFYSYYGCSGVFSVPFLYVAFIVYFCVHVRHLYKHGKIQVPHRLYAYKRYMPLYTNHNHIEIQYRISNNSICREMKTYERGNGHVSGNMYSAFRGRFLFSSRKVGASYP